MRLQWKGDVFFIFISLTRIMLGIFKHVNHKTNIFKNWKQLYRAIIQWSLMYRKPINALVWILAHSYMVVNLPISDSRCVNTHVNFKIYNNRNSKQFAILCMWFNNHIHKMANCLLLRLLYIYYILYIYITHSLVVGNLPISYPSRMNTYVYITTNSTDNFRTYCHI